jgi:redox-sensitive bicupin YhaK (pirin superfamily)
MLAKRLSEERGPTNAGWLDSKHSFSFGHYFDPAHMGFGPLRVINEDRVAPGAGFGAHPHDNMEIISYVLEGELAHKDSMGNGSVIRPGDIQLMSAGTGVSHSEFNNSRTDSVHFLQIWIMPAVKDAKPDYQQRTFDRAEMENRFRVVISPDGTEGSLTVNQDARMLAGRFEKGRAAVVAVQPGRRYWLQMARGEAVVNGMKAQAGDGFAIAGEEDIRVEAVAASEILVFDLP